MTPEMGHGGRVAIDPDDVRRVAVRMRGAALLLSGAGRDLAARRLPTMPPSLQALVTEVISAANAELQELALEFVREAQLLNARATWAEFGGGDAVSWLIPGLRPYPSAPLPDTPTAPVEPATDEQIRAGSEWAIEILDGMDSAGEAPADGTGSRADDVLGKDVLDVIERYADELPVTPLGRFTLAAGVTVEFARHRQEGSLEAGVRAGLNVGGGALGSALGMLFFSPTGWGIAGCAIAGGLGGSAEHP